MTTRARLRYFDDTGTERIIGRINETGGGSINEFTLRNSGTQYTKSTIISSKELFGSFPTETNQVTEQNNAAGPEIFVDVYDSVNNIWKTRDRVYAESQGVVNNDGSLKHKRLYGFEKYTGKQKVNISSEAGADASPVTTNIVDALQAALPTGYTVDAPGDITPPSINNYTFKGKRSEVYKELRENYEWLIWFTSETDGSGNYLVKFQPLGYGSQVDTFEKGADPLFFNKWTKDDELRRITEAEVVGTDENGNQYSGTASTNPNDGRFIRRNVGYLQSDTEAQNIAVNLIAADSDGETPESVEHGKITVPLDQPPSNNLNADVQVINSELSIDDLFTVVEQTDYFHQSQVEYSFEFEKELTNRDQQDKKDLKNRNAELVTSQQTDVGNQNVDADTEDVTDQYDSHNSNQHPHDVAGEQTTAGGGAAASVSQDLFDSSFSIAANSTGTITTANVGTVDQQAALYYITFRINPDRTPTTASEIQALAPTIRIRQDVSGFTQYYPTQAGQVLYSVAASPENEDFWNAVNHEVTIKVPNVFNDSTEEVQIETGGTPIEGVINVSRVGEEEHEHSVPFINDRAEDRSDGSTNDTNPSDSSAGDTTSLNADGSTDSKNVNTGQENKVDRG